MHAHVLSEVVSRMKPKATFLCESIHKNSTSLFSNCISGSPLLAPRSVPLQSCQDRFLNLMIVQPVQLRHVSFTAPDPARSQPLPLRLGQSDIIQLQGQLHHALDSLLAVFLPELEQFALSKALFRLRR